MSSSLLSGRSIMTGTDVFDFIRSVVVPGIQPLILQLGYLERAIFVYMAFHWSRRLIWTIRGHGLIGSFANMYKNARRTVYGYVFRIPSVRKRINKELEASLQKMSTKLVKNTDSRFKTLPKQGVSNESIMAELAAIADIEHTKWEEGYVSGAVYHGEDSLLHLQSEAYSMFSLANTIHPDVFPGTRKMEAEVVSMVLNLFNAPSSAAGVCTSGGTESILMAIYGARQRGLAERGVTEPEMIVPESCHPAFRKAAEYFKIKLHQVACPGPTYQADVEAMKRYVNPNTVVLVASAPNFPTGAIDDIRAIGQLASRYNICLHVDCCLGSFMMPCLEKAGFETKPFDFRVEGVTSISCDTHKYGFAPKGNSTVLYRSAELRAYQYFILPEWSGGLYASPGVAGSRPGALIAGCWASLLSVGEQGYVDTVSKIVAAAHSAIQAIKSSEILGTELEIIGEPITSVFSFSATRLNIHDIADAMSAKGWHLSALADPPALHVSVTLPIAKTWERLISDLEDVVLAEIAKNSEELESGRSLKGTGDTATLYGVAGAMPNKGVVRDLAKGYLDMMYTV